MASVRIKDPPNVNPLPVNTPLYSFFKRLYCPNKYPTSRPPTPISPAGTSVFGPMWRYNSLMKLWQKRITSRSLFPFGSKSDPPFPPPIGSVVNEFFNTCSNPKNLMILMFTDGWNRKPPL